MEDNFSMDGVRWGGGAEMGDGSGSNASNGGDGSGGDGEWQMKVRSLAHLLLCSPVPNRPWTGTGDWGPLP